MSAKAKRNQDIVETMIANGLAGNYDVVRRYIADDYSCHLPAGLPYGGEYHGWDGYTQVFEKMGAFFSEVAFGPNQFLVDEDKVVILSRVKGTLRRSGKAIDMPVVEMWELRDEMIVAITAFYYDTKLLVDLNTNASGT